MLFAFQRATASESWMQSNNYVSATEIVSGVEQGSASSKTEATGVDIAEVYKFLKEVGLAPQFDKVDNCVTFDYEAINVKLGAGGEQIYMYTVLSSIEGSKQLKGRPITVKEELIIHKVCSQMTKTCSCIKFVYEREADAILVTFESLIPNMNTFTRYFGTSLEHLFECCVDLYRTMAEQINATEN